MLVRVAEIPEEGLAVEGPEQFPRPFEDPAWSLEAVSLLVEKGGDTVFVRGRLRVRVPQLCGRCLEPLQVVVEPVVDARFVPSPTEHEERELQADDLETDVYRHGVIDLQALLETETTLGLPMRPLCRPECRGLCPVCGGNRNLAPCACVERPPDPRWAPLRAWTARLHR